MDFERLDIKQLIPQQEPFVMVGILHFCDEATTRTSFTIEGDNIFVDKGILENVAQTCAVRLGFLTINQPVRLGFIGAINDFCFSGYLPQVGDTIHTEIDVTAEIGNIIMMEAKVECRQNAIAWGKMKVALME